MGVDIPEDALSAILNEQKLWDHSHEIRNQSEHYHYRSLHKQVVHKRHAAEKEHMVTLRAVGCTTAKYVGSSGSAEATGCTATEEKDVVGDGQISHLKMTVNMMKYLHMSIDHHHQMHCLCCFSLTVNLLMEARTITTPLKLVLRYLQCLV